MAIDRFSASAISPITWRALCRQACLVWVGLAWVGLTLINGLTHIATLLRFRR